MKNLNFVGSLKHWYTYLHLLDLDSLLTIYSFDNTLHVIEVEGSFIFSNINIQHYFSCHGIYHSILSNDNCKKIMVKIYFSQEHLFDVIYIVLSKPIYKHDKKHTSTHTKTNKYNFNKIINSFEKMKFRGDVGVINFVAR